MSSSSRSSSFRTRDATKLARGLAAVVAAVVVIGVSVAPASAQAGDPLGESGPGEFAAGIGYAYVSIGDSDSPLHSEDSLHMEFSGSVAPLAGLPQLRLGAAMGLGFVFEDSQGAIISDGGLVVVSNSDVPLFLLEPEARVSWRQTFGDSGFFIEPGVGVGAFVANLNLDEDDDDVFDDDDDSFSEWDASFAARAFINVGVAMHGGVFGVQASYLRAESLDLGINADGDVEEFYLGIFGALQF